MNGQQSKQPDPSSLTETVDLLFHCLVLNATVFILDIVLVFIYYSILQNALKMHLVTNMSRIKIDFHFSLATSVQISIATMP